jgi:DNA primase
MKTEFVGFDALKRTVSMAQVLDRYGLAGRFHRSGDNLSGVCPLHDGHNPTQFRVSLARNCWICFGDCHCGGSIVDFVSRKEQVGIREAAVLIQDWFGITGNTPPRAEAKSPILPEINPPLRFTLRDLEPAHPYLETRGLAPETLAAFGVGYCTRGMLAGWIAIPIHNAAGQVVAYAGRWPGEPVNNLPKYRLPRGFRKSLELFNLHQIPKEPKPLVVVEGFFGCMKVWEAGCRRVVSLMGSMLSAAQEERIVQAAGPGGQVLLVLDEDNAGRKGRREACDRLSRSVRTKVLRLPQEGLQPDRLTLEQLRQLLAV